MNKYTVLPLLNSSFEPGKALETVEQFEDKDFRNIAMAELYYFTGKAKECCEITELYLENEKMELRLSACMLYLLCKSDTWQIGCFEARSAGNSGMHQ